MNDLLMWTFTDSFSTTKMMTDTKRSDTDYYSS